MTQTPEAMTRLAVTMDYPKPEIRSMLLTKFNLTEREADDMIARVSEKNLPAGQ